MTKKTLEDDLIEASKALVNLAREICWNEISDNFFYILSEIKNSSENFDIQRKQRSLQNSKKIPLRLHSLIPELEKLYPELYDINLYIYKAESDKTVIDIRYYSKNLLDSSYGAKVADLAPMLHCKVSHPLAHQEGKKFDVNWENL